jgi:hypothetical protein
MKVNEIILENIPKKITEGILFIKPAFIPRDLINQRQSICST